MSNIPDKLNYSFTHAWLDLLDDGTLKVGITDHAQSELGNIVFVEFPRIAQTYAGGEECAVIESVKTTTDLFCPVDGEIIDVNHVLEENPEVINIDPYGDGWIFRIKPRDESALDDLLDAESYSRLINQD